MSRARKIVILGIILSIFMASMEGTVVATATPTIVAQLGGLSTYSWVFSAFLVASTATVPIFGKLADLFGHRSTYAAAMALFLLGSLLCGLSQSMGQLIASRVIQGLGAGGVLPVAFTIVGAMFTYQQRARMQGLFSSIWGLSAIVGPLLGGFLVDQLSWRWIFFINIVPGLLATVFIWIFWEDEHRDAAARAREIDYRGAAALTLGIVALLLGLFEVRTSSGWALIVLAVAGFAALAVVERRAADPVLPLPLFRHRLFAASTAQGFFSGGAMFGGLAFVPLFMQAVMGTSATTAGATLAPFMVSWTLASIVSGPLSLRAGFRPLAIVGMVSLAAGAFLMTQITAGASRASLLVNLALMGSGMGFSMPPMMIAVQTAVARRSLGTATSTLQFSRSIGGAFGVSVMALVLGLRVNDALQAAGVDPSAISLSRLIDPLARAQPAAAFDAALRSGLTTGIQGVFMVAFVMAVLGLLATTLAPGGRLAQLAAQRDAAEASVPSSAQAEVASRA